MPRPAVFLDRDGVINRTFVRDGAPYPPANLDELEILPGVRAAMARLATAGFPLVVVTNQPDVARGTQDRAVVESINQRLMSTLPIAAVYVCYHDNADACECRKPRPGMLLQAQREHGIDLEHSWMVGDRSGDIGAGQAAGCRTILIDLSYSHGDRCTPDARVADLSEAADRIIVSLRAPNADTSAGDASMSTATQTAGPQSLKPIRTNGKLTIPGSRPASELAAPAPNIRRLRVKIFADGADKAGMLDMAGRSYISGLTTNPTLMRKAGISDYRAFARDILSAIKDKPISFEVFSDDFAEMERQAHEIASWGGNVYVKIPVTNTKSQSACPLIKRLADAGVKQNVTALLTLAQVRDVTEALSDGPASCVSVFAGRIADTGRDPVPLMTAAVEMLRPHPQQELIWASPRELLNIFQADAIGCHIITVTNDVLKKLDLVGKDLDGYSLETVKMFHDDAKAAGFGL